MKKMGFFARSRSRGVALVIVLGVLVLLTALVVALFSTLTSESIQSSNYARLAEAQQLADSAVNIVTAQLADATRGYAVASGSPNYSAPLAWASQPGAIRTWDVNGAAGDIYKLYSAESMVADPSSFDAEMAADTPAGWASTPALFTDLNSPVRDEAGLDAYPIVDPTAEGTIEGFSFAGAPTVGTTNQLPMPARWIYMLKDGTMTSPTGGTGNTASWAGAPAAQTPSKTNPVVGRIAFWTDDETAKVNINTASEGTFWDQPQVNSATEQGFANFQPAKNEFQRYPGHPAMTSLAPVFFATSATSTPSLTATQRNALYAISPRVVGGGSEAGTLVATTAINLDPPGRLYAHVDELIFKDARGPQDVAATLGLDRQKLMRAKFFLTANSRAPEVTLFNTPKISIWPIFHNSPAARVTVFDRLIAFCSTIGDPNDAANRRPYYFQRENPASPTNDISIARNLELYSYLQTLTGSPIPGFGGNFTTKYGADRDQLLTQIFDYIRTANLGDDNLVGSNRFSTTGFVAPTLYPPPPAGSTTTAATTMGFGRFYTVTEAALGFICNAVADDPATPLVDESHGSNITLTSNAALGNRVLGATPLAAGEKYIQSIFVPEFFSPALGWKGMVDSSFVLRVTGLNALTVTVGGTTHNLFAGADESVVYSGSLNYFGGRQVGGHPGWRAFAIAPGGAGKGSPLRGNLTGDSGSVYPFIGVPIRVVAPSVGGTMQFNGGDVTIELYAGNGTVSATPTAADKARLMQTITVNFPTDTFPVPNLVSTGTGSGTFNILGATPPSYLYDTGRENWWGFPKVGVVGPPGSNPGRLEFIQSRATPGADSEGSFFRGGNTDVVRSVLPRHGDFRITAASPLFDDASAPTKTFVKHPDYDDIARFRAHTLTSFSELSENSGRDDRGKYLSSVSTGTSNNQADIPFAAVLADTPEPTGDFDTGMSTFRDGPYINKPDEGNNNRINGSIPYFTSDHVAAEPGVTFFTPNRILRSAGVFGSLPTGVKAGKPWQTLLLRPQPGHPNSWADADGVQKAANAGKTPDHLLLDFFWMPVVDPYAISEPFSTAGKINMNYAIAPFSYIKRATGIVALLRAEKLFAVPNSAAAGIKNRQVNAPWPGDARLEISNQETLKQFQAKFDTGEIFKSATEICDIHIVPTSVTLDATGSDADAKMKTFWTTHALTGENVRERPYANLIGRLTTKSNTFTVHYKVQVLRQRTGSPDFALWEDGKDTVVSEHRGSTILERYIDPNDPDLPDFATRTGGNPTRLPSLEDRMNMDNYYRIRTVATKRFAP